MIDASRLSHSLATALKDRPHGIPIQPNRSLPLLPPPPPPIRGSVSKSPKNSPTSQTTPTHNERRTGCSVVGSPKKDAAKKGTVRKEDVPSLRVVGMNFYDSKGAENGSEDKDTEKLSPIISKGIGKSRQTKSLDNYESEEESNSCCGDKRRKSSDWDKTYPDFNRGKNNVSNFEYGEKETDGKDPRRDKKRRGRKRKALSTEQNYDLSGKPKSPRVLNTEGVQPVEGSKTVSQTELPTIYKFRKASPPNFVDKNPHVSLSSWKRTGSNTYKKILPKPANIPNCPTSIPIELARAMNRGNLRNFRKGTDSPVSQSNPIKPKNNVDASRTRVSATEDIENVLPSMPSLEDVLQSETVVEEKSTTLHRDEADDKKTGSDSGKELVPMIEARVPQILGDLSSKSNGLEASQGNTDLTHDPSFDKSQASIFNLTTVLQIQIAAHSPGMVIVKAPQMRASGQVDGVANNSPVEATAPVLLSSSARSALEEPRMIEEAREIDTCNGLAEYREDNQQECPTSQEKIAQDNYTSDIDPSTKPSPSNDHEIGGGDLLGNEEPRNSQVDFEDRVKDTSDSSQSETSEREAEIPRNSPVKPKQQDSPRIRRIKREVKCQKYHKEEVELLTFKMSQTNNPAKLTRLQQRINCAKKKIENIQKNLSVLGGVENSGLSAKPAFLSRIQVRRDLIQKTPSSESSESDSQSPLRSTSETDEDSTGRSLPVSPQVITISETDSASSGDETDTNDEKSPDNVKPPLQTDTETKFIYECISDDDTEAAFDPSDSLPDIKAQNPELKVSPEITNNNVEYINKNLDPVGEVVSTNVNTPAASGSPQIPTSQNNISVNIPPVSTNLNDAPLSIAQVPINVNTASMNIPPLIRDPIDYSLNKLNDFVQKKSPSTPYGTSNLNSSPNNVNNEQIKPNCKCPSCLRGSAVVTAKTTTQFDPYIPNAANDLRTPSTICRTAVQENTNVNPVPNYPVHRNDYRTTGNVPSMFSKDNGGANINLSSPLQGHSALSFSPTYYRTLTAQGYPIPGEPNPNQQTLQWNNLQPQSKSSAPLTPEQEAPLHSPSVLASYLLKPVAPDPANFPGSTQLSSLNQSKDTTRTNPPKHIAERVMNAQFPTLGNWAADKCRESVTVNKAPSTPISDRTAYKTTGSDLYKMAATAVDPTHPQNSTTNTIHWPQSGKPTHQPRPTQTFIGQRNIAPNYYQKDHLATSTQIPQNPVKPPATYPGSEVFVTCPTNLYYRVPSGPQNTRSNERSSGQLPAYGQQNPQYQTLAQTTRPLAPAMTHQTKSPQLVNPTGFMPQQYAQQPATYLPAMVSQWQSGSNYQSNYPPPQYNNTYYLQSKTTEQNSGIFRTAGRNLAPKPQPQAQVNLAQQNISHGKLHGSVYGIHLGNLNQGPVQEVRNGEGLGVGRSYVPSQLGKVQNSLQCSRCGRPGPKYNCFSCENAFYCNKDCQTQHWSSHLIECSKKMPKLKKVS